VNPGINHHDLVGRTATVGTASSRKRQPSGIRVWSVRLSRFLLAALFLFTAVAKLAIIKGFAANVADLLAASGINASRWMWAVTILVIVTEVIAALLLLWPRSVRLGALLASALLLVFAGYALYYVYVLHGEPLECGCFGGIIASQLGVKTALRNLILVLPAVIVFFGYKGLSKNETSRI